MKILCENDFQPNVKLWLVQEGYKFKVIESGKSSRVVGSFFHFKEALNYYHDYFRTNCELGGPNEY